MFYVFFVFFHNKKILGTKRVFLVYLFLITKQFLKIETKQILFFLYIYKTILPNLCRVHCYKEMKREKLNIILYLMFLCSLCFTKTKKMGTKLFSLFFFFF